MHSLLSDFGAQIAYCQLFLKSDLKCDVIILKILQRALRIISVVYMSESVSNRIAENSYYPTKSLRTKANKVTGK